MTLELVPLITVLTIAPAQGLARRDGRDGEDARNVLEHSVGVPE